jgi:CheY-like chemotaxis protein
MLTNAPTPSPLRSPGPARSTAAKTILIVNGDDAAMHLLDTVLEAGRYDVVFVESTAHAYSQVKRVQPSLVILCTGLEKIDGFQVLSMLKLDEETRQIPVLTYATGYDGQEPDEDEDVIGTAAVGLPSTAAGRMN